MGSDPVGSQLAEDRERESKADGTGNQLVESSKDLPSLHFTLSVMAPRSRLKVLNSEFAETLNSLLPLHPTLCQLKSPLEDWLASDLLVIEVPVLEFGKEIVHNALQRLIIRAKSQGPHVMLVVTPRSPTGSEAHRTPSRGEHNMEIPIRRWNEWMSCPFQLK